MQFRADINGLRAFAVIAVVLFHFNPSIISGGFAGVDVFFVISGFLMTSIIFKGLENNNFSLAKFYVARANRIIPALVVLCLVLLVFGFLYLSPLDFKQLGKHVAASLSFVSNFSYWRESGYFDVQSHEKWLLHTWSLSVEWQFYILYPIVLVICNKFLAIKYLKYIVLIGALVSFIVSIYVTIILPSPAYYLLPTRGWEMMFGALAYLFPLALKESNKKYCEYLGLLLIFISYTFITQHDSWPGYFAMIPVFGTYLIIISNRQTSLFTNNRVFQKLGTWSYSIYLWHWPVVVFGYYYNIQNWIFIGIPLSLILGGLSYKLIEQHRLPALTKWRDFIFSKFAISTFLVLLFGYLVFAQNGLPKFKLSNAALPIYQNLVDEKAIAEREFNRLHTVHKSEYAIEAPCSLDDKMPTIDALSCVTYHLKEGGVLVIGDSHGGDFYHAYKKAFPEKNIAMLHQSSCAPSNTLKQNTRDLFCFDNMENIIAFVNSSELVHKIIFASRYTKESGTNNFISDIENKKYQKPIIIVNSGIDINKDISNYIYLNEVQDYYLIDERLVKPKDDINQRLAGLGGPDVYVFDKYGTFCKNRSNCWLIKNNKVLMVDDQHLSVWGIEILSEALKEDLVFSNIN